MRLTSETRGIAARLALMFAVYATFAFQLPSYYSVGGISALLDGAVLTGIIAVGIALTMIAGEMDLSVGSMAAMAGILAVYLFPLGLLPAILAVTALCGALGALQGWCIHRLNINSVVFTIGSLIGIRGMTLFISGEKTALIPFDQIEVTDVLSAKLWIFTPLSLCMLAMFFLFEGFAQRTIWGRETFAVGGGRAEARAAGVSLRRPTVLIFTLSAALAGLAGALLSLKSGSASPLGFDAVLLEAITACLIGGIALSGGRGRILSVLIGLMTIRFLVSGIAALGAPFWAQGLATGALLIFVIAAEAVIRLVAGRRVLLARSPA